MKGFVGSKGKIIQNMERAYGTCVTPKDAETRKPHSSTLYMGDSREVFGFSAFSVSGFAISGVASVAAFFAASS